MKDFKNHFWFSKNTITGIAQSLEQDLSSADNRGLPLSPEIKVFIALGMYGGGQFQRIAGLCGGVSQYAACKALMEVTDALLLHRNEYIYMPSHAEMEATAQRNLERFDLPRFALGVDGVMLRFQEAPRKLPDDKHQQQFWCRKQFYAINAQVVGDDKLIRDIDVRWPGSTHDARVWCRSEVKPYLEQ